MGIGNTTSASAIAAVLTKLPVDAVTGRGTGLDLPGTNHKTEIVKRSLHRHFGAVMGAPEPLEVLRCVGGLEIAAMTGFILCAAANRMAVVCDGFISTAAAAVAYAIAPASKRVSSGWALLGRTWACPLTSIYRTYTNPQSEYAAGRRNGSGSGHAADRVSAFDC